MVTTTANLTGVAAEINYVDPQSDITYVNVKTDIHLEYDSKNKNLSDSISSSDIAALTTLLNKSDSASPIEVISIRPGKAFSDSVTPTDLIVVSQGFGRSATDSVGIHDNQVSYASGPVLNTFVMNNGPLLTSVITSPNVSITAGKNTADTVNTVEQITYVSAVGRSPTDAASMGDTLSPSITKYLNDSVALSDDFAIYETLAQSVVNSTVVLDVAVISIVTGYSLNGNVSTLNSAPLN